MKMDSPVHQQRECGTITTNNDNTITRSNLRNCAVTSSYVKRSSFEDCVLVHVRSASRSVGKKSHFHNVTSIKRSDVNESTLLDRSSTHRGTIRTSTIRDASTITRSSVTGSTISRGHLRRATLKDCVAEECIISRSSFEGMILKYGVWKKGQLVGRIGNKEPIAIRKDGPNFTSSRAGPSSVIPIVPELDSKPKSSLPIHDLNRIDSEESAQSDFSEHSDDLPPPYSLKCG